MCGYCALTLTELACWFQLLQRRARSPPKMFGWSGKAFPMEVCQEKARAFAQLQVSGSDLAKWVLSSGTSTIQNKLSAADTSVIIPTRETPSDRLGGEKAIFASRCRGELLGPLSWKRAQKHHRCERGSSPGVVYRPDRSPNWRHPAGPVQNYSGAGMPLGLGPGGVHPPAHRVRTQDWRLLGSTSLKQIH